MWLNIFQCHLPLPTLECSPCSRLLATPGAEECGLERIMDQQLLASPMHPSLLGHQASHLLRLLSASLPPSHPAPGLAVPGHFSIAVPAYRPLSPVLAPASELRRRAGQILLGQDSPVNTIPSMAPWLLTSSPGSYCKAFPWSLCMAFFTLRVLGRLALSSFSSFFRDRKPSHHCHQMSRMTTGEEAFQVLNACVY